jgi:hypothetical protein
MRHLLDLQSYEWRDIFSRLMLYATVGFSYYFFAIIFIYDARVPPALGAATLFSLYIYIGGRKIVPGLLIGAILAFWTSR